MRRTRFSRLMILSLVISLNTLVVTEAPATMAENREGTFVPEIYLFPIEVKFDKCSDQMTKWIAKNVGRIMVSCTNFPIFSRGLTRSETYLMKAGIGVYPYIAVDKVGRPILHTAVTLPAFELKEAASLKFVADTEEKTIALTSQIRTLTSLSEQNAIVSFDLPADVLPPEFLARLAAATGHTVFYNEGLKRKLKISGDNAQSIDEMVRLYKAIAKDAGIH